MTLFRDNQTPHIARELLEFTKNSDRGARILLGEGQAGDNVLYFVRKGASKSGQTEASTGGSEAAGNNGATAKGDDERFGGSDRAQSSGGNSGSSRTHDSSAGSSGSAPDSTSLEFCSGLKSSGMVQDVESIAKRSGFDSANGTILSIPSLSGGGYKNIILCGYSAQGSRGVCAGSGIDNQGAALVGATVRDTSSVKASSYDSQLDSVSASNTSISSGPADSGQNADRDTGDHAGSGSSFRGGDQSRYGNDRGEYEDMVSLDPHQSDEYMTKEQVMDVAKKIVAYSSTAKLKRLDICVDNMSQGEIEHLIFALEYHSYKFDIYNTKKPSSGEFGYSGRSGNAARGTDAVDHDLGAGTAAGEDQGPARKPMTFNLVFSGTPGTAESSSSNQDGKDFMQSPSARSVPDKASSVVSRFDTSLKHKMMAYRVARDLGNFAPNHLYPESYAQYIKGLFSDISNVQVHILDEHELLKEGMNSMFAVGMGAKNRPCAVIIEYKGEGTRSEFDLSLIGKGVCFDSGGISLKPGNGMWDMKYDMCGSAAVVGSMYELAASKANKNVIGIVGLVENMPGGGAQRPADVVKAKAGMTIEVLNTDAEGRLVLVDLMELVHERYKVRYMVDIATLTGAMGIALGSAYAGLFTNSRELKEKIASAAQSSGELVWHMPICDVYRKQMKSSCADIANIATSSPGLAGSATAAAFLEFFVRKGVKWAHLDVAYTVNNRSGGPSGATGYGVELLSRVARSISAA